MENNWRRIIMLDVDGVVNSEGWYNKTKGRSGDFDPEAIKLLNQLKDDDAEVVISSSWGDSAIKPLQDVGLELPIIGCTDHYHQDWICRGNEIEKWFCDNLGSYGTKYGSKYYRSADAADLLADHGIRLISPSYAGTNVDAPVVGGEMYVIFDDDSDMLLGQKDNFIQTNRQTGVTQADIDKAKAILERKTPGE